MERKKLLLHTCCASCSIHVAEMMAKEYDVTLIFHNPQIFPATEYSKRLAETYKVAKIHHLPVEEGNREYEGWQSFIAGFEDEPEGGKRCSKCFQFNLEGTARHAKTHGFDLFSTTLTVSPHKNAEIINEIGRAAGKKYGVQFLERDFKKEDGFLMSSKKCVEHEIYRQDYCGCEFSLKRIMPSPKE